MYFVPSLSKTGTGMNVYEAMSYAANMNTRPSVGKVMVVVTCEEVFDGSLYGDVLTMLSDNDIKMHYITPHQLALRRSIKSDRDVLTSAANLRTISSILR